MKIDEAAVALSSSHEFSSERIVHSESTTRFRTLVAGSSARLAGRETLIGLEQLIARLLEWLTGVPGSEARAPELAGRVGARREPAAQPRRSVEISVRSEATETIREHEQSAFSARGTIRTSDGRALDFSLELSMSRDFARERRVSEERTLVLRDPLVINFAGQAAALSGRSVAFDLDADGTSESLRALAAGSGYLAIDRNGDGRINDGSELFGTRSGDGFADLALLDGDGNRWLDEADAAFAALRVWQAGADAAERLCTLAELGVGALYLASSATPFALTDADNRTLAQIRASGVYLREDGGVGTLQQVDLAV